MQGRMTILRINIGESFGQVQGGPTGPGSRKQRHGQHMYMLLLSKIPLTNETNFHDIPQHSGMLDRSCGGWTYLDLYNDPVQCLQWQYSDFPTLASVGAKGSEIYNTVYLVPRVYIQPICALAMHGTSRQEGWKKIWVDRARPGLAGSRPGRA